jgi:hypothetical protein
MLLRVENDGEKGPFIHFVRTCKASKPDEFRFLHYPEEEEEDFREETYT